MTLKKSSQKWIELAIDTWFWGTYTSYVIAHYEGPTKDPVRLKRRVTMAQLSTKELADELGTDPKTLRKFLRTEESGVNPVGQGRRYAIEKRQLRSIQKRYAQWVNRPTARRTTEEPQSSDPLSA